MAAAGENLREALRELDLARHGVSDADLLARVAQAQRAYEDGEAERQAAERQLDAANPDEVMLRAERARSTLTSVQAERSRLRDQAIGLQSRLDALGKGGIGEVLEEARGELARAVQRYERLRLDSQAWDLLVSTLGESERDAKEAFLEPVIKRVDPFLRLLLPDAHITLDEETLEIRGVARQGREEPYHSLSVGTREQLSILVRLAFAVYLREKGYPAAVILDDALVYADDDRFERMQLALRKAAETVQVLILTCRPRDWRQFGSPVRRLTDSRAPLAASN